MINSKNIDDLFPTLKRAAIELKRRMKQKGFDLSISSTYRDIEYQNSLYAQGRTKPGNVITNAKGGQSYHNYRLAFDIIQNKKGSEYDLPFLQLAGKIAAKMGLEWGGNWQGFVDMPHMQWSDGLTLSDLQKGKMPVDKKLKWELDNIQPIVVPETFIKREIDIQIDGKIYNVESILFEESNYIKLKSFIQAGYDVTYVEDKKLPCISNPNYTKIN